MAPVSSDPQSWPLGQSTRQLAANLYARAAASPDLQRRATSPALFGGVIAAVVIGSIIVALIIAFFVTRLIKKSRAKQTADNQSDVSSDADEKAGNPRRSPWSIIQAPKTRQSPPNTEGTAV